MKLILSFVMFLILNLNSYSQPTILCSGKKIDNNKHTDNNLSILGFGSSGNCNVNVNCTEGDNWEKQKRSVVKIYFENYVGSGVLINTTRNNFTPYILTACHVIRGLSPEKASQLRFCFNYQSPDCSNISNDNGIKNQYVTGYTVVAFSEEFDLDFALLKLNSPVPKEFNPYFAGWSVDESGFNSGVCIHHPKGDIKKISTIESISIGQLGWYISFKKTLNGHGITEVGSSGSPIFNSSGLIVGTLRGGSTDCDRLDGVDYFGRFSNNMDFYPQDTASLRHWLDPDNSGVTSITGTEYPQTTIENKPEIYRVFPNPCNNELYIEKSDTIPIQRINIVDVMGRTTIAKLNNATMKKNHLDFSSFPKGPYFISIYSGNSHQSFTIIKQ